MSPWQRPRRKDGTFKRSPARGKQWYHKRARRWLKDHCEGDARRHHWELHAHHRDGNYRNNRRRNVATLCRWCHLHAHGKRTPKQAGWKYPRGRQ